MKNIVEFLNEALEVNENKINQPENKVEEAKDTAEESIKDEKSFKEYAKNKFEEVFGDDLDENQMNETIDGILKDYKEDADNGDWGKLVGVLNKSFGE
jgi:cysteinyl-tRNA synthetase